LNLTFLLYLYFKNKYKKKAMKKIISVILFSTITILSVFSQGVMSNNGLFVASTIKQNNKNYIYIHKFLTKELIRKIPVSAGNIDKLQFSNSGNFLAIKSGKNFFVWDIFLEKNIITVYNAKSLCFSPDESYLIILKSNSVVKYKTNAPYNFTNLQNPNKEIYRIKISPDSKLITALGVDKVYIYKKNSNQIVKTINAFDIKFSADGKYFTILSAWQTSIKSSVYNAEKLYQEHAYISTTLLPKVNATRDLIQTRCTLGENGKFFTLYTAKKNEVEIFVFDAFTGNHIWTINNFIKPDNELFPQVWINQTNLIAYGKNLMAGEYDVINHKSSALGLRIDNFTASPYLSLDKQQNNRKISPNYKFVAIQAGNNIYFRDTRIPNKMTIYENSRFLCYSPDSKYIFIESNGKVNAIVANQLSQAIKNKQKAKLYAFNSTMSIVTKEDLIPTDKKPPKGYAYFYVNNSMQIVKLDTAKLHYVFKTVNVNKNNVELQVNLVDAHGNEFVGAVDPSWKFIWCNLLLQKPNGTVTQVNNFQVEEKYANEPTA